MTSAAIMADAVVGEEGARKAALLEGLGESRDEVLGRLLRYHCSVTGQTGAVVQDAERQRRHPLARGGEHLARAVMEVEVPEAVDVLGLEAAHLAVVEPRRGAPGAGVSAP